MKTVIKIIAGLIAIIYYIIAVLMGIAYVIVIVTGDDAGLPDFDRTTSWIMNTMICLLAGDYMTRWSEST